VPAVVFAAVSQTVVWEAGGGPAEA
jgi:hypothetical protein